MAWASAPWGNSLWQVSNHFGYSMKLQLAFDLFPVSLVMGLAPWIEENKSKLEEIYTPEWQAEYPSLEEFACEIFIGELEIV